MPKNNRRKEEIESHKEIKNEIKELREAIEKLEPMVEWFNNMNFMKRTFMFVLKFLASVGGLILLYRQIFK